MNFSKEENKYDIVEHEILEGDLNLAEERHLDPEAEIYIPLEATETKTRNRARAPRIKKVRKNKYGWAMFLCSLMLGLAGTATLNTPLYLFVGLGIGFLFFVDPIYNKVLEIIDRI